MSYLLREGAAVLLWHALPHRLLDWLDLLAQRDPRCSGGFDYFSVYRFLFFILSIEYGHRKHEKRGDNSSEKVTRESGSKVSQPLTSQPVNTHVGFRATADHMERAVGQVEASEAAGSLQGPKQNQMSHIFKKVTWGKFHIYTQQGTTHSDSCLAQHLKRFD